MRPGAEAIMRNEARSLAHVYNLLLQHTSLPISTYKSFMPAQDTTISKLLFTRSSIFPLPGIGL